MPDSRERSTIRIIPTLMDLAQFQVHADLEQKHWWFLGRRHLVATLLHELVPPGQGKKLVDVGCGTGGVTAFFSREYSCTGVDPSPDGIAFAKRRFPECSFVQGNAPEAVKQQIGEADAVVLLEVLEHVEQDRDFVQSLLAAMKSGAVFITMAPADPTMWGPHDAGFGHFRRYDERTFRALWQGANTSELLVSHCNTHLYPLAKTVRFLSRLKGSAWGPGNTDLALPAAPVNRAMASLFRAEAPRLKALLRKERKTGYRFGVSLMAVPRKT